MQNGQKSRGTASINNLSASANHVKHTFAWNVASLKQELTALPRVHG